MTWPRTSVAEVSDWCRRHLGSPVDNVLFETGFASQVLGLRLADGQEVVVKVRAFSPRIPAAVMVQRQLCCAGFPCPRPLTDLMPLGEQWISAESLVLGGAPLRADHAEAPELYAAALAELIRLAPAPDTLPTLLPPPDHAHWNHAETGVWPRRHAVGDVRDTDLNQESDPVWLRQTATLVRLRLARFKGPDVVGHADWWTQNLRWIGRRLHVVHDWDSVTSQPEAILAGERGPQIDVGAGRLRIDLDRAAARRLGFGKFSGRAQHGAEIAVRLGVARRERDGAPVMLGRVVRSGQLDEHDSEIVLCQRILARCFPRADRHNILRRRRRRFSGQ